MAFNKPGKSYEDMWDLIHGNLPPGSPFSLELILAICWEESMFNNMEQVGGSAWGFGQVEPAEFYKFEKTDSAYRVLGLPPRHKVGSSTRLAGKLTETQSIQVVIATLMHNYTHLSRSKMAALGAYAGVGYTGTDVPEHLSDGNKRMKIVRGWLACEEYLQRNWTPPKMKPGQKYLDPKQLPDFPADFPTFVKTGLSKARKFDIQDKAIDDVLFPKTSFDETGKAIWLPNGTSNHAYYLIKQDMQQRGLV